MLPQARQSALKAVGVQILAWTWRAYRDKARGNTDGWGLRWKPITKLSIAGRLLKRAVGRAILKMLPKGSPHRVRAAILHMAVAGKGPEPKNGPTAASQKRDRELSKFAAAVDKEHANHEIGVDTGRLVNSLQFGKPQNLIATEPNKVTVGTLIEYGDKFDAKRTIFPNDVTADQKKQLEGLVIKSYEISLRKGMGGK